MQQEWRFCVSMGLNYFNWGVTMDPISVASVLTAVVFSFCTTCVREVVGLAKTTAVNIVYRKENKCKKLIARKDELVKRDIECEKWGEMSENKDYYGCRALSVDFHQVQQQGVYVVKGNQQYTNQLLLDGL